MFELAPQKCTLRASLAMVDTQLLSNGQTSLSDRRVWSAVWGGARVLGTRCQPGSYFVLYFLFFFL